MCDVGIKSFCIIDFTTGAADCNIFKAYNLLSVLLISAMLRIKVT